MIIRPTIRTASEIAALVRSPTKPAPSTNVSTVLGRDVYASTSDESPYLNYNKLGGSDLDCKQEGANEIAFEAKTTPAIAKSISIYDFTKSQLKVQLDKAMEAYAELDTADMTKGQIYSAIESIIIQYAGNDFREAQICGYGQILSNAEGDAYRRGEIKVPSDAYVLFDRMLRENGIDGPGDSAVLKQAKGYNEMSQSEIRTAVRSKYPDVMTLKDCLVMHRELFDLGLERYPETHVKSHIIDQMGGNNPNIPDNSMSMFIEKAEKLYNALLELPADYDTLSNMTYRITDRGYSYISEPTFDFDMDSLIERMLSAFSRKDLYSQASLGGFYEALRPVYDAGYWDTSWAKDNIGYGVSVP